MLKFRRCLSLRKQALHIFFVKILSNQHKRTDLQTEFGYVIFLKRKSRSNISIVIRAIPHLSVHPQPAFARLFQGNYKPLNKIFSLCALQYKAVYTTSRDGTSRGAWGLQPPKFQRVPCQHLNFYAPSALS